MITPVILAGGNGTRLWPLSRALYPKQFLKINSEYSLIQQTVNRLEQLPIEQPLVVCNEEHRFIVAEQLRAIDKLGPILLEPEGKNTAPAVALAALHALEQNDDAILLVLSADHVIQETDIFCQTIEQALPMARHNNMVTFGVVPTKPETGYGYIQKGAPLDNGFKVNQFVEKPDLETATAYIESGDYLWNSGMFLFSAKTYLEELAKFNPNILSQCKKALSRKSSDMNFTRIDASEFHLCPADSIDYAVFEHTTRGVVLPLAANWSDVGNFAALWEIGEKDEHDNVTRGDVVCHQSNDNLVLAENSLVTTVGINNAIVVQTKDAVLVAKKDKVQHVKAIVEHLKQNERTEVQLPRQVYRPWGSYDGVDYGERYQVKHIVVNPGEKLSIQMHHHRAEHWVVVSGSAKVTNGDKTFLLSENESTFIPVGVVHALENPGKIPVHIIEVQTGSYLGEDDIVRFEDRYGRN
ncbi:mannose-1-phosphate guanylyltransferase/mannose-6-phosphate isomerase [Thalassotalea maritima]|uniref:mannose-1-phosphate guanylyltransferase/mannose-6-phosphate isomerase n=1 Tax=Thalassotalea maritima TaxID=3242416 RepID=UPI0035286DCF